MRWYLFPTVPPLFITLIRRYNAIIHFFKGLLNEQNYSSCVFFAITITGIFAQTDELKYIFSLDTNFTMTALKNYGFGIGINYEHKLTDFLSIRPGFGHMVCFSDITTVTVGIQLFLYYYPLSNGLDKLYVGLGNGCDFLMYINDTPQDTVISLTPLLGWKFFLVKTENYDKVDRYLNKDFQWGLGFKLFMKNK